MRTFFGLALASVGMACYPQDVCHSVCESSYADNAQKIKICEETMCCATVKSEVNSSCDAYCKGYCEKQFSGNVNEIASCKTDWCGCPAASVKDYPVQCDNYCKTGCQHKYSPVFSSVSQCYVDTCGCEA